MRAGNYSLHPLSQSRESGKGAKYAGYKLVDLCVKCLLPVLGGGFFLGKNVSHMPATSF